MIGNKQQIIIKIVNILILVITIISVSIINVNLNKKETIETATIQISNTKKCWGIKRGVNNSQPDVGSQNRNILEENNGICLGNKDRKKIYLTFDNGYEAGYTEKILEDLKNNNVNATFFITAHYLNTQPDLVKRMIDEGHIVGNHTVNHKSMPELSESQIRTEVMDLHTTVYKKFGYEMKYIRPPKGEFSERTLNISQAFGYKTIMWSFAYEDWNEKKQPNEEEAKNRIISNLHNGEIMLLHANSKTNANILDYIIKEIKKQGYEFKSLDEFEK